MKHNLTILIAKTNMRSTSNVGLALWVLTSFVMVIVHGIDHASELQPLNAVFDPSGAIATCSNTTLDAMVNDMLSAFGSGGNRGALVTVVSSGTLRDTICADGAASCSQQVMNGFLESGFPVLTSTQAFDGYGLCAADYGGCLADWAALLATPFTDGDREQLCASIGNCFLENFYESFGEALMAIADPVNVNRTYPCLNEDVCSERRTGIGCTSTNDGACGWCASSYSCLPESSLLCPNECSICTANPLTSSTCDTIFDRYEDVNPPPEEWDFICKNEGVKVWSSSFPFPDSSPNQRFGGVDCNCPSGWEGNDCAICKTNSSCAASTGICNYGWIPTASVPLRSMRCECTSDICEGQLDPETASAGIELQMVGADSFEVELRLDRRIPHPGDRFTQTGSNQRQSTVLAKASVTNCKAKRLVNCKDACNGCTNPWGSQDYCNVLECENVNLACPPNTVLPGSNQGFQFHGDLCSGSSEIKGALVAPFTFACIDNGEDNEADPVTCSFSTGLVGHGTFVLSCDSGVCANEVDPLFQPEPVIECGALQLEKDQCDQLKYSVAIALPCFASLLILGAFSFCGRATKNQVMYGGVEDDQSATLVAASSNPLSEERYSYLVFKSICFDIKTKEKTGRRVLDHVNGYIGGPQLTAILGESGSGKTSLIDILAGRKNTGKVSGVTALGGFYAGSKTLRQRVGYVMQDDILPGTSTVYEYLSFHAHLRMQSRGDKDKHTRIQQVIAEMGLSSCAHSKIGDHNQKGISGGEKRRVSIACELLANKSLIIMDEPTSGLDSKSSQDVISALKMVVHTGRGVAVSIHQPSSRLFTQFDRVIILSTKGMVYQGPGDRMVDFFSENGYSVPELFNPAEFALDIVTKSDHVASDLIKAYRKSPIYKREIETINRVARINPNRIEKAEEEGLEQEYEASMHEEVTSASFWLQFQQLAIRFTRNVVRNPILLGVHFGATLLIALVAGFLYYDVRDDLGGAINRAGFFFFFLSYLSLSALSDLGQYFEGRLIFIRERAAGCYNSEAYLLAKFLCEILPLRLAPIALSTVILVELIGLQDSGEAVGNVLGVFLLVSIISVMLMLVIGMSVRSNGVANFLAVVVTLFALLMSGFLLIDFGFVSGDSDSGVSENLSSLWPFGWLPAILGILSYLRPAFEILMVNELSGLTFNVRLVSTSGQSTGTSIPASGDLVLAQLNLQPDDIKIDFGILMFWFVFFSLVAAILLRYVVKEKR